MLDRRTFVKQLLAGRGDALLVTGLGSATYDAAAVEDHPLNFYLWGAMGGTAMVGLGLALARPDRRVVVLTGDGDALMGIGSFATIGVKQPKNLGIVVLDNRHYGETGMQQSHTHAGIDLAGVARACRFAQAVTISGAAEVAGAVELALRAPGPVLVQAQIEATDDPRVMPTRDGVENKLRFVAASGAKRTNVR